MRHIAKKKNGKKVEKKIEFLVTKTLSSKKRPMSTKLCACDKRSAAKWLLAGRIGVGVVFFCFPWDCVLFAISRCSSAEHFTLMGRVRGLQAFALVALVSLVLVSVSEANRPDDQDSVLPLPFYLRSHDSSATIRSSTLRDRYSSSYHAYQLAVNSSNDADTPLIEHQLHLYVSLIFALSLTENAFQPDDSCIYKILTLIFLLFGAPKSCSTRELEGVSIAYLESLISWSSIKLLYVCLTLFSKLAIRFTSLTEQ